MIGAIIGNRGDLANFSVLITTSEFVFEYDELGNLVRQVRTVGDQVSETLFEVPDDPSARICQSLQAAFSNAITVLPISFDCSGTEVELDSLGRPQQITNNFNTVVSVGFTYEGALLTSQTTRIETQTGELLSSYERRYAYDAAGNLVEGTRVENGVVTYRLTRSYGRVELEQLP